eukprot:6194483-Pleurochrysis_carterae.AAC.3
MPKHAHASSQEIWNKNVCIDARIQQLGSQGLRRGVYVYCALVRDGLLQREGGDGEHGDAAVGDLGERQVEAHVLLHVHARVVVGVGVKGRLRPLPHIHARARAGA